MMKKVPCPKCDGRGHVVDIGENSIGGYQCGECFGTGQVEVPMTNADRIRAMTDEELVNVVPCPLGFSMFRCPKERKCGDCKREWLQQPCGGA